MVTQGEYLKRGAAVEVVSASPLRVVVRAARPPRDPAAGAKA